MGATFVVPIFVVLDLILVGQPHLVAVDWGPGEQPLHAALIYMNIVRLLTSI